MYRFTAVWARLRRLRLAADRRELRHCRSVRRPRRTGGRQRILARLHPRDDHQPLCQRGGSISSRSATVMKQFRSPWNQNFAPPVSLIRLELGIDEGEPDAHIVCRWTGRFAAAVVAVLPTEKAGRGVESQVSGYPEGALTTVQANRYERDRRNRAAAIAIHGTSCKGCGLEMDRRYGIAAAGFVEIHHVTPVALLGPEYVIDPANDLVPLCPNCHAVAHRCISPFSIGEIQSMLRQ